MGFKRIVSFLPSATELLYELDAGDCLVGVTHECVYPEDAKRKPRIIKSVFDPQNMTSLQIDKKVSELARNGDEIFLIDDDALRKADPDLIIAQGTCAVCSAHTNEVDKALRILGHRPEVEVLDPHTIEDILSNVITIARKIGREKEGKNIVQSLQKRIDFVRNKPVGPRPKVLCIEWVEPFFTSGHWIPQMVQMAGGTNLVGTSGQHSRRMTLEEVEKADPDIIVMMPCGFDAERTEKECATLQNSPEWQSLRAVKTRNVFAVDANSYFSKPSIRTVTGIEILAKIINPKEFEALAVPLGSFKRI